MNLVNIYENGTLQFKAVNSHNQIIDNFTLQKGVQPHPKEGGISTLPIAVAVLVIIIIITLVIFMYIRR